MSRNGLLRLYSLHSATEPGNLDSKQVHFDACIFNVPPTDMTYSADFQVIRPENVGERGVVFPQNVGVSKLGYVARTCADTTVVLKRYLRTFSESEAEGKVYKNAPSYPKDGESLKSKVVSTGVV